VQDELEQNPDAYRVLLDGRWKLVDLYEFPHAFSQCYAFIYCLDSKLEPRDAERIETAFVGYPWRGGYSYVNIYTVLQNQVPVADRPQIKSISYASPGWLDIFLNVDVAIQVAKSVGILAGSAVTAATAYAKVMKTLTSVSVERKKAALQEMMLTQAQYKTFMSMCDDMAKFLSFKNVKELHKKTGSPEVSLKLLAAHYRRTNDLVEFVKKGKASLQEKVDG
jgi:hypothetical protein